MSCLGLVVSLIATLGNLFVVYVALAALQTPWTGFVKEWGPLILLLCSGLDFYAGIMEFGFFNASFDERWEAWNLARHNDAVRQEREASELEREKSKPEIAQVADDAKAEQTESALKRIERAESEAQAKPEAIVCDGCGKEFGTVQALSAHRRWCSRESYVTA